MKTKNKESAFPTTKPLDGWGDPEKGMTLRDYFAAKAMQGMITNLNIVRPMNNQPEKMDAFCKVAYEYADAMLKQREI